MFNIQTIDFLCEIYNKIMCISWKTCGLHWSSFLLILLLSFMSQIGKSKLGVLKANLIKSLDKQQDYETVIWMCSFPCLVFCTFWIASFLPANITAPSNCQCCTIVLESFTSSQRSSSTIFTHLRFVQPTWSVRLWFWIWNNPQSVSFGRKWQKWLQRA